MILNFVEIISCDEGIITINYDKLTNSMDDIIIILHGTTANASTKLITVSKLLLSSLKLTILVVYAKV